MSSKKELVNHPSHYSNGSIECIDALLSSRGINETMAFCICNAMKYLWRLGKKDSVIQEVDKAIWYLNKYKELYLKGN